MRKWLVFWMIAICNISLAQNNFYFKRIYTEADEFPTCMQDFENSQLFLSAYYNIGYRVPTILKFKNNCLVDSLQVADYNGTIFCLNAKDSSTFTAWGFTFDNILNKYNLAYWLIDTSLNVLENKNYLTKFNEQNNLVCNHLNDGNYLISLTGIGSQWLGILYLICDPNGDLTDSIYFDYPNLDYGYGILKYSNFNIAPLASNYLGLNYGTSACFVKFDSLLNVIRVDTIPPRQSGISLMMNIKKKNEKEFYLCGKSVDIIGGSACHRVTVSIFDTSYQVLKTVHFGNLISDTLNYPASYTSFNYKNLQNLYLTYTYNFPADFPWSQQKTWVAVCNLDSNLNIRWRKFVGGDLSYNSNALLTSSDGGCYVTGTFYDSTLNIQQRDIFILRFDSLGNTISDVPDNAYLFDTALIYPNPGSSELNVLIPENIKTTTFELYNSVGVLCKEEQFDSDRLNLNTNELKSGLYFYRLRQGNNIVSQGKWVKE
ncbi:MAG: T9SS type A sorting domain-containing protein [Bacteroidales bacterium]|mgnify:CR=1 FL=1|jgi:hypothetical protein|nr:T9SS type A sorting domain-containing protein [Bacteroidales bacterium]